MIYSLRGMAFTMIAVAVIGGFSLADRGLNYAPAKASVFLIDRTCNFTQTTSGPGGKMQATIKDSCNSTDEFATIRKTRSKMVDGKAVVKVTYTAPQDGSYQTSQLTFDGRDDEFYKLKAGDTIDVLVSNEDHGQIRKK